MEIEKEKLGPNHVNVARSFMWLGYLYCKKGDLEKAKDYYQLTQQIRKEQSDPKHVDVIKSNNKLAVVYRNTGDLEKAKDYYERALEIQREKLDPNHLDVAAFYIFIGHICHDNADLTEVRSKPS